MPEETTVRFATGELDALRKADVSPEFMTVIRFDPERVGKNRNSAREETHKMLRAVPSDHPPETLPFHSYGGGFFDNLRAGDLGEAFIHADIANIRILLAIFGRDYLIERLISDAGWASDRAQRYVDERIENYGTDLGNV